MVATAAIEPAFSVNPEPTSLTPAPVADGHEDSPLTSNRHDTSLDPTSDSQAEVSNYDAEKAIRSAEIAIKAMNCYDTWEKAVERVRWVMTTISPIAEVCSLPDCVVILLILLLLYSFTHMRK